jgi:hypothetical protein
MSNQRSASVREVCTPDALCVPSTPADIGESTISSVAVVVVVFPNDNDDEDDDDDEDGGAIGAIPTCL